MRRFFSLFRALSLSLSLPTLPYLVRQRDRHVPVHIVDQAEDGEEELPGRRGEGVLAVDEVRVERGGGRGGGRVGRAGGGRGTPPTGGWGGGARGWGAGFGPGEGVRRRGGGQKV